NDAALEIEIEANPGGAGVPEVAEVVLESVAVPGAGYETAGFIGDRVVQGVAERPEGIRPEVCAVGINIVFSAWGGVLEIILAVMLGHPCAFNKWFDQCAVVFSEALPAMQFGMKRDHFYRRPAIRELIGVIQLDAVKRIQIRRAKIHEPAIGIVVVENRRIPGSGGTRHV